MRGARPLHNNRATCRARRLGAMCVLVIFLFSMTPSKAEASGGDWGDLLVAVAIGALVEIVVPDTWVEFGDDGLAADMSWPLVVTWLRFGNFEPFGNYLRSVTEVHVESGDWTVRGLFGGRLDMLVRRDELSLGIFAEGGYVVGEDSNAPMVGGGLIVDNFGSLAVLLMYRTTFVEVQRHEMTLNLELALPVYLLYQDD